MCEASTIGLAVGLATTAASTAAASNATSSQNKFLERQGKAGDENYLKGMEAVRRDVGLQTDALMAQQIETIAAQKQQLQGIAREARLSGASYLASTGESGIEGRVVDLVHQDFERNVLDYQSAALRNITNYTAQMNREAASIYARGQSMINSGYPAPLAPYQTTPYALLAVQGLSAGLNAYGASRQAFTPPVVGTTGT